MNYDRHEPNLSHLLQKAQQTPPQQLPEPNPHDWERFYGMKPCIKPSHPQDQSMSVQFRQTLYNARSIDTETG